MRWLDRLLARRRDYALSSIAALGEREAGAPIEIEGRIEAQALLEDPVDGSPAVALLYRAHTPALSQRFFGVHTGEGTLEGQQATDFVLRDGSGAALIEVVPGGDVGVLHRRLQDEFGIGLQTTIERIAPGDRVRVRGRIREHVEGSPHRRPAWTVVVSADELLQDE